MNFVQIFGITFLIALLVGACGPHSPDADVRRPPLSPHQLPLPQPTLTDPGYLLPTCAPAAPIPCRTERPHGTLTPTPTPTATPTVTPTPTDCEDEDGGRGRGR